MGQDSQNFPVWVLADARSGTSNQALGVADALSIPFKIISLCNYPSVARLVGLTSGAHINLPINTKCSIAHPPWPHIIIAAGRRAAWVARYIRAHVRKTSLAVPFLVQIMFPGWRGLEDFDLVAIPNHDRLLQAPDNVLHITGAPHRITPMRLVSAAERWRHRFNSLPRPRIACLVGGASGSGRPLTAEMARTLATQIVALARLGRGSILLTTSRRTDENAKFALLAELTNSGIPLFAHHWGCSQENPYTGLLALADAVVVTGDSVSMCTEACAQSGPVFIFSPPGWVKLKHARLHAELFSLRYARPLPLPHAEAAKRMFSYWGHPPLNPAGVVAQKIRMQWR